MALERYREKRRFERTPEPRGDAPGAAPADDGRPAGAPGAKAGGPDSGPLYVIQKHAARRLHYDFRLELDGVLVSWAVPKGPSLDPADRHLAVHVEDHPLEYGSFEGTIPAGEYGGGTVELWDRGSWEPENDPREGLQRGELKFTLHGQKLRGSWVLARMKPRPGEGDKDEWLLIKHRDEHAVDGDGQAVLREQTLSVASGRTLEEIAAAGASSVWHGDLPAARQPDARPGEEFRVAPEAVPGARPEPRLPRWVRPELATLVERPPDGAGWLHEIKLDGYRMLARVEDGSSALISRNGRDWSGRYPLLVAQLAGLPASTALLDGEVVAQMPDGTTDFQELQNMGGADVGPRGGRLFYHAFDLLHLGGYDLTGAAIEDRKLLLQRLLARAGAADRVRYADFVTGHGGVFWGEACRLGLEGVVSKKAGSVYRAGVRGGDWLKAKCLMEQEFVVGGFTDPGGSRTAFGGLLLGVYEAGELRYAGKVGTGFDERTLVTLGRRLRDLQRDTPPFHEGLQHVPKGAHWVEPRLVAQVVFSEWTREGHVRHSSFKGLREDKAAEEVTREWGVGAMGRRREGAAASPVGGASPPPQDEAQTRGPERGGADGGGAGTAAGAPRTAGARETAAGAAAAPAEGEVRLTHPDRVFWPRGGQTKLDLVTYYRSMADLMLPYLLDRPISMVRCPDGVGAGRGAVHEGRTSEPGCFFHKHPGSDFPGSFRRIPIEESAGVATYIAATGPDSLTALAQMGVLEIHIWGSTWPRIEQPDMMVFDLDPDPSVGWRGLTAAARLMRNTLQVLGLESFVKTTGGKGLHVVVPMTPGWGWDEVRDFCRAVAQVVVAQAPERYTATMSKAKRVGKVYIDYVRNTRGATSIAPFSTRAKEEPTVAVPLRWSELSGRVRPDTYTMDTISGRLRRLRSDPWEGYFQVAAGQTLTDAMRQALATVS